MKIFFLTSIALAFSITISSQTYITNVTITDVENQKLIPNQTVVITNDLISDIQSSKNIKVPENAIAIDGTGKYLAPGLTDAHMHFSQNGGLYTRPDAINLQEFVPYGDEITTSKTTMENKLRRYLKNGITTVFDVGSPLYYLEKSKTFEDKYFAPTIYMTGPLSTTYKPEIYKDFPDDSPFALTQTIEEGIKSVQDQLPYKPDFIKIWYIVGADGLSVEESARKNLPIVKAIIDEAHKNNLKIAVHATQRITAQLAVENGADFLVHSVDDEILKPGFVQLMKKNKVVLCPTLIVSSGYANTFGQNLNFSPYDLKTANPFQLGTLLDLKHLSDTLLVNRYKAMGNSNERLEGLRREDSISRVNLKILLDAGVTIATGTDAGNLGTLHVSSYQAELKAMQASGMSNWQILVASTINGAKILNKENQFGSIAIGKKANLILLDENPIQNLENLTKINKVINKGVVFDPKDLVQDTPEILVQRQLNGYNFRNIEAFLEPYAEDVELYGFPDTLLGKGKEAMRQNYSQMFENTPNLHCELVNRIVQGNTVIDQERVQRGDKFIDATVIYTIENEKIKKVYFVRKQE
ncbi:amidohydrolase family protein [Psychroserpens burtonensis]|uniref:Amidohydrolase family protein n=1 Tax=Psychroserpens burtonensis TaxID=49278 RepID=A0A5C7B8R5_9FLAO|nr:amidohydrolase family protein [Psychroserpens burtonensis]TXE18780.1 amidohydrolase family protein [Psychroserpens burtonensis]